MSTKTFFTCLALCAALAVPATATGALKIGVVDDTPKGTLDGGAAFYSLMRDLGMTEIRMTVFWDPSRRSVSQLDSELLAPVTVARVRGIKVIFAVQPTRPLTISTARDSKVRFATFFQDLARRHPYVKDFIVGNEPNQTRFWRPQFNSKGEGVSCAGYEALLAHMYDALKAVNRRINVIGVGLSPRGNDNPKARSNVSTSPVRCIRDMGRAYRASGRTWPIMDELGFHPYPQRDTHSMMRGYGWPNAGIPNLDRVKQAFWDAFHGTGQPTFPEGRSTRGIRFRLDEVGWQVGIAPRFRKHYQGRENIKPTSEGKQAKIYADLIPYLACDRSVGSLLFFGLMDEPHLDRWQAGLVRAGGSKRPAFARVKRSFASSRGRCRGKMRTWTHATSVIGAGARFPRLGHTKPAKHTSWTFRATADEDATYRAGIFRASTGRGKIVRALSGRGRAVLSKSGVITAHRTPLIEFPKSRLRRGRYVYAIKMRAAMNPARDSFVFSRSFRVAGNRKR
jgi:hypothetical protein